MMAAFAHSLLKVRHHLAPERATEIAIGFLMAFIASVLVVKPFLAVVDGRGFGPFAGFASRLASRSSAGGWPIVVRDR